MRVFLLWKWSAFILLSFAISALGQDPLTSINGPALGFVEEAGGTVIHPIRGVLGASVVGAPLVLESGIRNAVISPKQNYALAIRDENAEVVLIQLGLDTVTMSPLDGVQGDGGMIAISPTGSAAAVYRENAKIVQAIKQAPDTPQLAFQLDTSDFPGLLHSIAISDDAGLLLLTFNTVYGSSIWAVNPSGSRWLLPAQGPSAAMFLPNRHDAVVGDDGAQEVFLILGVDEEASRVPVASFGDGFDVISGLGMSDDGRRVFVTSKKSQAVTLVDLESKVLTTLPCNCAATGLHPLKGTSLFRLSDPSTGPVALLDASSPEARIIVLPVMAPATGSESVEGQQQ